MRTGDAHSHPRILRVRIKDGSFQYIITNLPESYTLDDIREIYHKRWHIETGYEDLKYGTGMNGVHARKIDSIRQEIYAKLTLYNLSYAFIKSCERKLVQKPTNKYRYVLNKKYALELCRFYFTCKSPDLTEDRLEKLILKHKCPVKEPRTFDRKVMKKVNSSQHRILQNSNLIKILFLKSSF